MSKLNLAAIEKSLRSEKERLLAERTRLAQSTGSGRGDAGELTDYDPNHPADASSDLFDRGKDMALAESVEVMLGRIDAALAKIEAGTYGICEVCGERIPDARLHAIPDATMCLKCQSRYEA
jgi:phage/conjugal plasmid C-4 type zinc finger TraR family protein